ncbi:MAG TPA: DUF559 domain-containing protein [Pseudolysinimonas sp.]|nr:DUF559 domain-containing protein [Pseudolysinimonas sp.]
MTRRTPLPAPFDAVPFRVGSALAAGVARNRLDARDLVRLHHGARTRPPSGLRDRCADLSPLMSATQGFTGPTAALLLELPLSHRIERDDRLHVSSLRPQRAMRRPGVVGTERGSGDLHLVDGLAVLAPEAVWIALGRILSIPDLVAVADRLVTGTLRTPPLSSLAALHDAVGAASGQPGVRRARLALPRIRVGSWSRPETFVRLLIEQSGLPEPSLNREIRLDDGRFAIADLSWPEYRVVVEYDGKWHGSQQDADADRHERLVDAGWVVSCSRRRGIWSRASSGASRSGGIAIPPPSI